MHKFPSWYYGPKGESAIFQSEADVPEGWQDHPSKHKGAEPAGGGVHTARAPANSTVSAAEAAKSTTAGSQTKAGLWRMKVGVARPEPKPGYPLDL